MTTARQEGSRRSAKISARTDPISFQEYSAKFLNHISFPSVMGQTVIGLWNDEPVHRLGTKLADLTSAIVEYAGEGQFEAYHTEGFQPTQTYSEIKPGLDTARTQEDPVMNGNTFSRLKEIVRKGNHVIIVSDRSTIQDLPAQFGLPRYNLEETYMGGVIMDLEERTTSNLGQVFKHGKAFSSPLDRLKYH
jgi:hypothetical protein